ncbi:hypothetical protein A0256_00030 [Mucilaginibacter sp. PAMC 26640]|nr:hypothetical protein A0256_00030 [Mucilaginibacter sp. PAMC 26640]
MNKLFLSLIIVFLTRIAYAVPVIYVNQIAFDSSGPKAAVVQFDSKLTKALNFALVNATTGKVAYTGLLTNPQTISDWMPGKLFFQANFSEFRTPGNYRLRVKFDDAVYVSFPFEIGVNAVAKQTVASIIHYYNKQRANTPGELAADAKMQLFGSNQKWICMVAGAMHPAM